MKSSPGLKTFAEDVTLVLGGRHRLRFLKKSPDYGKLDLLSVGWDAQAGKLRSIESPHWDAKKFADSCAGCHTTAVDPQTRAFSALALDCYTCHGEVTLNHSKDTQLVHLSKKRHDPARVVMSICAQCHVRTGKSKSNGLRYPNNFVAGDNLFRDFQMELSPDAKEGTGTFFGYSTITRPSRQFPIKEPVPFFDRHILDNVRDVVLLGKEETTCLSCHDVHKDSTRKHRRLLENPSCLTCHNATGSKKIRKTFEAHSQTCEY